MAAAFWSLSLPPDLDPRGGGHRVAGLGYMLFPLRFYFLRLNLTGFVAKAATDVRQHIGELLIGEKVVGGHNVVIRFTVDFLPLQAF